MNLPADFPHRRCVVPGWATSYRVPRYISRVDIDEQGLAGTHGWQVRYDREHSKFFSDSTHGKRHTPRASLDGAIEYLAGIYRGPRSRLRRTPTCRKTPGLIQDHGIRMVEMIVRKDKVPQYYVEVMAPTRRFNPKRYYVGTVNTITPERIERALVKARKQRKVMEQEYLKQLVELPRKGDI